MIKWLIDVIDAAADDGDDEIQYIFYKHLTSVDNDLLIIHNTYVEELYTDSDYVDLGIHTF